MREFRKDRRAPGPERRVPQEDCGVDERARPRLGLRWRGVAEAGGGHLWGGDLLVWGKDLGAEAQKPQLSCDADDGKVFPGG